MDDYGEFMSIIARREDYNAGYWDDVRLTMLLYQNFKSALAFYNSYKWSYHSRNAFVDLLAYANTPELICKVQMFQFDLNSELLGQWKPIDIAVCCGNKEITEYLLNPKKVEMTEFSAGLLKSDTWKMYASFKNSVFKNDTRRCIESLEIYPDLIIYSDVFKWTILDWIYYDTRMDFSEVRAFLFSRCEYFFSHKVWRNLLLSVDDLLRCELKLGLKNQEKMRRKNFLYGRLDSASRSSCFLKTSSDILKLIFLFAFPKFRSLEWNEDN
jgi:hypothetical protein